MTKQRSNYLTVSQAYTLNAACIAVTHAFDKLEGGYGIYQVGSSLLRPDYRDVDLRCILSDAEFDRRFGEAPYLLTLINFAISDWLAARTGLPVDFQIQRATETNAEHSNRKDHPRNAVGMLA